MSCPYVKQDGQPCGRNFKLTGRAGAVFTVCGKHRHSKSDYKPCSGCGVFTRATYSEDKRPMCTRQGCGLNCYRRELAAVNRADASKRAQEAEEKAQQEQKALAMDDYVTELVEELDLTITLPPAPASWEALSDKARAELMLWLRAAIAADPQDTGPMHEPTAAISTH